MRKSLFVVEPPWRDQYPLTVPVHGCSWEAVPADFFLYAVPALDLYTAGDVEGVRALAWIERVVADWRLSSSEAWRSSEDEWFFSLPTARALARSLSPSLRGGLGIDKWLRAVAEALPGPIDPYPAEWFSGREMTMPISDFLAWMTVPRRDHMNIALRALGDASGIGGSGRSALLPCIDRGLIDMVPVYRISHLERWWAFEGLPAWRIANHRAALDFLSKVPVLDPKRGPGEAKLRKPPRLGGIAPLVRA